MNCLHQNTIDDIHTGDEICTSCGLVLDRLFLAHGYNQKDFSQGEKNNFDSKLDHRKNSQNKYFWSENFLVFKNVLSRNFPRFLIFDTEKSDKNE